MTLLKSKKPTRQKKELMDAISETESSRLNVDIEKDLYIKIKQRAVAEGRSIKSITRDLWLTYLESK